MSARSNPQHRQRAAADFRRYLQELAAENDLVSISKEVDPQLELAVIVRKVCETESKPPLFESVKGAMRMACSACWAPRWERAAYLESGSFA